MSVNTNTILSHGLSLLTYNGETIATPKDKQLNIFMGLGLWSHKDGLSEGLPVDVMQMLLSATIMRSQIMGANLGKSSKVIILIADSMAVREGSKPREDSMAAGEESVKEEVVQIVTIYKKSLEPLLDLLNIKGSSEIILSSELECCSQYQDLLKSVENSGIVKQLKKENYDYVCTQTAITRYMNRHRQAGIKVGWINSESASQLKGRVSVQSLKKWDELMFDQWCEVICEEPTMQYLYAKAGLKQSGKGKKMSESCPYLAYPKHRRYTIQTQDRKEIKTICPHKRVVDHWRGVAEVCSSLAQAQLVHPMLLPEEYINERDAIATVHNMLNHWVNPLAPSGRVVWRSIMPQMAVVRVVDKSRGWPKCMMF